MDPLAEKYPGVSPYVYCLNNPLIYVDPDGRDPIIVGKKDLVTGKALTNKQITGLVSNLQKITNDKLAYNSKTGTIDIVKRGTGSKKQGTELIRDIISSDKALTINIATGKPGASTGPTNENSKSETDARNGKGTDTTIDLGGGHLYLAKDSNTGKISKEVMSQTNLLDHELIHGLAFLNGEVKDGNVPHYYKDASGKTQVEMIDKEEAYTVGFDGFNRPDSKKTGTYPTENSLRKEQGDKQRVNYGF